MNRCVSWWSAEGHFRGREVGVTIIQQFRYLGPFTHALSSSLSVDHGVCLCVVHKAKLVVLNHMSTFEKHCLFTSVTVIA